MIRCDGLRLFARWQVNSQFRVRDADSYKIEQNSANHDRERFQHNNKRFTFTFLPKDSYPISKYEVTRATSSANVAVILYCRESRIVSRNILLLLAITIFHIFLS